MKLPWVKIVHWISYDSVKYEVFVWVCLFCIVFIFGLYSFAVPHNSAQIWALLFFVGIFYRLGYVAIKRRDQLEKWGL